ncbi:hypothetical protein Rhopal_000470-T1 [Rhodotorula paludigena]|uniref:Proteophosphoglycan ppg4 n=1 Tax=Rhodotorula paludigena TaxID=86838 RepID=A0AAV5GAS9_9BASI|nr:hypothetical protein Rhopal_000470-T1 [Rhodotorula paludigena]
MPHCFASLPANARAGLVLLRRPCVFVLALAVAAFHALLSLFFAATHLEPPSGGCPTRASLSASVKADPPQTALQSLSAFVSSPFRQSASRPPPARRASARKIGQYTVHELDGVVEIAEEDEEARSSFDSERAMRDGGRTPSLTHDGSSDDAVSEVETLVDHDADEPAAARIKGDRVKGAGLTIFTSGFRWKRTGSLTKKDAPSSRASASSTDAHSVASSSPTSSAGSGSPTSTSARFKLANCPIHTTKRHRSSTVAHSPRVPSTLPLPDPVRRVTDPHEYALSPHSSATPSSSRSSSPSLLDVHPPTSLAHPTGRKRAATSFFRSLSPLSRSPLTSPEPSPPPSPRLGATGSAQRVALQRKSSLEVTPGSRAPDRRGRSPGSERPPPIASPPLSNAVVDLRGSSGLVMSDLLH